MNPTPKEETYAIPASILQSVINALLETQMQGFARVGRDVLLKQISDLANAQDEQRATEARDKAIREAVEAATKKSEAAS